MSISVRPLDSRRLRVYSCPAGSRDRHEWKGEDSVRWRHRRCPQLDHGQAWYVRPRGAAPDGLRPGPHADSSRRKPAMRRERAPLLDCCVRWLYSSGSSRRQPPRTARPREVSDKPLLHSRQPTRRLRISDERDRLGAGATSRSSSTPAARPCGCRSTKTLSLVAFATDVSHKQITRHSGAVRQCLDGKVRCRHAISATEGTDRG